MASQYVLTNLGGVSRSYPLQDVTLAPRGQAFVGPEKLFGQLRLDVTRGAILCESYEEYSTRLSKVVKTPLPAVAPVLVEAPKFQTVLSEDKIVTKEKAVAKKRNLDE